MTEVNGVRQLALFPRNGINAYVIGDVLVDAGMKGSAKKIIKALDGQTLSALAITHAHIDHVGGAKRVCEAFGIPLWAGADDVPAVESGVQVSAKSPVAPVMKMVGKFAGLPVGRALREGDEVGGFRVIDAPGHSPGHVAYFRDSDRTLICGDVFLNMNLVTTAVGLHNPPDLATPDPDRNRESQRKLVALEPETVLFGHGPPLTGAAPKLRALVEKG